MSIQQQPDDTDMWRNRVISLRIDKALLKDHIETLTMRNDKLQADNETLARTLNTSYTIILKLQARLKKRYNAEDSDSDEGPIHEPMSIDNNNVDHNDDGMDGDDVIEVLDDCGPTGNGDNGNGDNGNGDNGNGDNGNGPTGNGDKVDGPIGNGPTWNGPVRNVPTRSVPAVNEDNGEDFDYDDEPIEPPSRNPKKIRTMVDWTPETCDLVREYHEHVTKGRMTWYQVIKSGVFASNITESNLKRKACILKKEDENNEPPGSKKRVMRRKRREELKIENVSTIWLIQNKKWVQLMKHVIIRRFLNQNEDPFSQQVADRYISGINSLDDQGLLITDVLANPSKFEENVNWIPRKVGTKAGWCLAISVFFRELLEEERVEICNQFKNEYSVLRSGWQKIHRKLDEAAKIEARDRTVTESEAVTPVDLTLLLTKLKEKVWKVDDEKYMAYIAWTLHITVAELRSDYSTLCILWDHVDTEDSPPPKPLKWRYQSDPTWETTNYIDVSQKMIVLNWYKTSDKVSPSARRIKLSVESCWDLLYPLLLLRRSAGCVWLFSYSGVQMDNRMYSEMMIKMAKDTVGRSFGILQVRRTRATDDFKPDKNGNHDKAKVEAGCKRRMHSMSIAFSTYNTTVVPDGNGNGNGNNGNGYNSDSDNGSNGSDGSDSDNSIEIIGLNNCCGNYNDYS